VIPEDYVWLNPLIYQRWLFTADKIERQPELLEIPLRNIERWIKMDRLGDVRALIIWREMIEKAQATKEGFAELQAFLRDDGEYPRMLKSCSPFPGVLTKEERRQFTCVWTH
jgi:predicted Rossmann fold nucleotide-binding protein DprA/Smf involved in DNA uptake